MKNYLLNDITETGSKFFVISFIKPISSNDIDGFKISGIFETIEEATEKLKEIQGYEKHIDFFIGKQMVSEIQICLYKTNIRFLKNRRANCLIYLIAGFIKIECTFAKKSRLKVL
jgi:hypothetical protein